MKYYNNYKKRDFNEKTNNNNYWLGKKTIYLINNNSKNNNFSQIDKNLSNFELLEKKVNSEINAIKIQMKEIKENDEIKQISNQINYILKTMQNFETVMNKVKSLENKIIKMSEEIKKFESTNNYKNQKLEIKENKYIIDSKDKINIRDKNLKDFITLYKKEDLGFKYYEPYEIEEENRIITDKIKNSVFEYYLPENEICENEKSGKFLYSIGGISRISQNLANYIYLDLFNEYKTYLQDNNEWLTFNHEEDRKKLSIWVKKCLHEKQFFNFFSNLNKNKIKKYLYSNDEKTNEILLGLFTKFIKLYTKCLLSYPLVEVSYTNYNCKFENSIMLDIIYKGNKGKLVNFCYLPGLKSNGQLINGGKFYVFTFIKGSSFQIKEDLYDDEITVQKRELYKIPNSYEIQIIIHENKDIENKMIKIQTIIEPKIPIELKPIYRLMRSNNNKFEKLLENKTGIFQIEKKYLNDAFYISIFDYLRKCKNSKLFKIDNNRVYYFDL